MVTRPRIDDLRAVAFRAPVERPLRDSRYTFSARQSVIVVIETNFGLRGIGEAASFGSSVESLCAVIDYDLRPLLVDEDPSRVVALWEKLFRATYQRARRDLVLAAISGIDTALWDLAAKSAGVSLAQLFGGDRCGIPVYASGGFYPAEGGEDTVLEEMTSAVDCGIDAVKIKLVECPSTTTLCAFAMFAKRSDTKSSS